MDNLIGTKLSHYRVVRKVGEGGMGVVYQARDPHLERDVALKVLGTGMLEGQEARKRFRREALALSRLNHPNIATIYDFDSESGVDFLVMELIHGTTLGEKLKRGPIPGVQAIAIGVQIAEALDFAHGQGVIHRDLKPGNVMVAANGLVKVLDFGLAQRQGSKARTPRRTKARALHLSQAMGTPGYMSPEQVLGSSQDHRTDLFAFGSVVFECLAGERAFEGESAEDVIASTLTREPRWSSLPDGLPSRVKDLLAHCLEKDVGKRLQEIQNAKLALEAVLGARRRIPMRLDQAFPQSPHNLPRPDTSFIGRDAEIAECRKLLGHVRLLTLTGPGGCGKTRLALQIAEGSLADFPDGVWFADLAPLREGTRVAHAVASAAGLREEPDTPLLETIPKSLREKRALLLMDNCERHLGACAEVGHAVLRSCPNVAILATSREGLRISGEHAFLVPPLRVPSAEEATTVPSMAVVESVRLFTERASHARPGYELSDRDLVAVAEICRRLDGIPLAIELAASRVMVLTPEEIRARLDRRFRLLTSETPGTPERHQTLRAAIQWSYEQLTREEQELFRALSVFAGSWTFESAASVCGGGRDEFAVLDLFTHLLDKSLLVAETAEDGTPRYRYLETIREYALVMLEKSGEAEPTRERHLDYFLALAEEAAPKLTGPEQASWLKRLDAEHENLLTALRFCHDHGEPWGPKALRLTAAIWRFWAARGHFGVGRRELHAALSAPGARDGSVARAETLNGGGALLFHIGDWAQGRAYCEESLGIFSALGQTRGMADAHVALGNLALGQGDYASARTCYDRALEEYREIGYRRGMGVSLSNSGRVAELQGDDPAASRLYAEGLAILREVGDLSSVALRLSSLGQLSVRLGNRVAAREQLMECLALVLELKEKRAGNFALERSAALLETLGEPREAAVLCAAAEVLCERIGSPLTPRERGVRDELIGRLRETLGGAFRGAWIEGTLLTFEAAVPRALASLEQAEPGKKKDVPRPAAPAPDLESTAALLEGIRGGDARATARLMKRYLPILRRWAHGRLPSRARSLADTDDLVQVALIRGLGQVENFEQRRTGAFLAYMRQILRNQIRDHIRRPASRTEFVELEDDVPDAGDSPLEEAIGRQSLERYEAALATLTKKQREGIVMRLELGFSYREIAEALGSPSEEAARIAVRRALERLKERLPDLDSVER